jgi:DNA-binding IclR family transcriptional regulator
MLQIAEGLFPVYASLEEIQAVWASVSSNPGISVRSIAAHTGIGTTKTHHILHFLEEAGFIQHESHCTGRRVLIPFVCVQQKRAALPSRPATESEAKRP